MKVFTSDCAVRNGSADTFSHQILAVVLGLGSRIHSTEPRLERLMDQVGRAIFLPGCSVDEDGEGGWRAVLDWTEGVFFPGHFADSSCHFSLLGVSV